MRRLLLATLAALALALPARAQPVELQIHLSWGRQANTQKVVAEAFMKKHPEITVKFRPVTPDYTTGLETILRQTAVGQAPDITFQATNLMAQLVDRNLAVDLTPMLATIPDLAAAGYTPSVLNLGRFGGRQFAMAFLIGSPVLYFNLDLVKRAGGEGQMILTRENGEPPLNTLALGPAYLGRFYEENPQYRAQLVQVQAGQPWFGFPGPNSAQITEAIGSAQESVVLGRATPDAAFAEMVSKVRSLLP